MKEIKKLMTDDLRKAMDCRANMLGEARHWKAVNIISSFLNSEEYTYDEFLEIVNTILHFTRHESELQAFYDYIDCDEDCDDECKIDIDGEDGEWFVIPEIG